MTNLMRSRFSHWTALAAASALTLMSVAPLSTTPLVAAAPVCTIAPGFYDLAGQLFLAQGDDIVGDCTQSAHMDPENRNVVQPTSSGLLFQRSCDQVSAFTDGNATWLLGPNGLQSRQNADPLFDWECTPGVAVTPPAAATPAPIPVVPAPAPAAYPAPTLPGTVACPDKIVNARRLDFSYRNHPQGTNWRCADAYHVKLTGADLSGVDLQQANLETADVSRATFAGARLALANLVSLAANGSRTTPGPIFTGADLRGVKMSTSGLTAADFRNADLSNADLSRSNFTWADLRGADLRGADVSQANFTNANLTGAYLCGANTTGTTFKDAVGVSTSCG
jgi:pentapeptide repeat protein